MNHPVKTLSQLRPILLGFRKAAGLTQAMVASHLGVTQQTYAQLEANPEAVSVERFFKVLRVLSVDLMLTQSDQPQSKVVENQKGVARSAKKPASAGKSRDKDGKPITGPATKTIARKAALSALSSGRAAAKKRENW